MNNGIWKRTGVLVLIATLLVSISSISSAKVNIDYSNGEKFSKKMRLSTDITKVSTGIFRGSRASTNRRAFRVDNAPYAGRGISKRHRRQAANKRGKTRVRLAATNLPSRLGIENTEVEWLITSSSGKNARKVRGKFANVRLSPGTYSIRLRIGSYKKTQTVTIHKSRNNAQNISIATKLGLLNVSSSLNGAKNAKKIRWTARNRAGRIIARGKGHKFRHLVPAGRYKVEANYGGIKRGTNVVVRKGAVGYGVVKLPAGSIKISAYHKSIREPMFSTTRWVIYNKDGRSVHRSKKHNLRLTLFPGRYTAKLTAKGKTVKKTFTVSSGRNADVRVIVK